MDGLSAAASITALIQVGGELVKYLISVHGAKQQIDDLEKITRRLQRTFSNFEQFLLRPDAGLLPRTGKLDGLIKETKLNFDHLVSTLEDIKASSRKKITARIMFPITLKAKIEDAIRMFSGAIEEISEALQVDMADFQLDAELFRCLPEANGASYDSHHRDSRRNTTCYPSTRVDILKNISDWADDSQASPVYWLYGPAGTGKSTICRTAAQSFRERKMLGASFFFKKGEEECGKSSLLFPTIATQLVQFVPNFKSQLRRSLHEDKNIATKQPQQMFDKLLIRPLSDLPPTDPLQTFVVAIDALDEGDGDMAIVVDLLARATAVTTISLRFLVTSREEPPIRRAFAKVGKAAVPLALHRVNRQHSESDIRVFLKAGLAEIATNYGISVGVDMQESWPGRQKLETLVAKSCTPEPLFIYAATLLRFLDDKTESFSPDSQLQAWLKCNDAQLDQLLSIYQPILRSLLTSHPPSSSRKLCKEIREIVGSIAVLVDPLPVRFLGSLLAVPADTVNRRVSSLRAVLEVPDDPNYPVRLLHKSFADYILSPVEHGNDDFSVAEASAHEHVADKCIALMRSRLDRNMCGVAHPGLLRTSIEEKIKKCFGLDLKYACRFWAHHVEQGNYIIKHGATVYEFLRSHFLHWLEALGLLGKISDSLSAIRALRRSLERQRDQSDTTQGSCQGNNSTWSDLSIFLHDAERFVLCYRSVIDSSPLQIYASALVFAPKQSIIRRTFKDYIPKWIYPLPNVDSNWNAVLQTLEGHSASVLSVAFSNDGTVIASGSYDHTIKVWDAASGDIIRTLEGHSDSVSSVAFSNDGTVIASGSRDGTIKVWDAASGDIIRTLEGHSDSVLSVAFSNDGTVIASGSDDGTIKVWDAASGDIIRTLKGHSDWVSSIAFSNDGTVIASGSYDGTIKVWDAASGDIIRTLDTGKVIYYLSFTKDDLFLITDNGSFSIGSRDKGDIHSDGDKTSNKDTPINYGINADGTWITANNPDRRNVLWLPPDYRPVYSFSTLSLGSTVAIGCASGRMVIMGFRKDID